MEGKDNRGKIRYVKRLRFGKRRKLVLEKKKLHAGEKKRAKITTENMILGKRSDQPGGREDK